MKIPHSEKLSQTIGLEPGTVVHIGEVSYRDVNIIYIRYNKNEIQEITVNSLENIIPFEDTGSVHWIHIDGIHEISVLEDIGGACSFTGRYCHNHPAPKDRRI